MRPLVALSVLASLIPAVGIVLAIIYFALSQWGPAVACLLTSLVSFAAWSALL